MTPILADLQDQAEGKDVELIVLQDNGSMTIGTKQNYLFEIANGDYVSTVADDDFVSDDYVDSILPMLGKHDVVTFDIDWQGGEKFSDWKPSTCGLRPIAAVRTEIARKFTFPAQNQSEDQLFASWLGKQSPTQVHIDKILYRYNWRRAKPEFGGRMYRGRGPINARRLQA